MKSFSSLKGGGGREKFYPVLRGWGVGVQKVSDLRFSHFVAPPPVINDQSLKAVLFLLYAPKHNL